MSHVQTLYRVKIIPSTSPSRSKMNQTASTSQLNTYLTEIRVQNDLPYTGLSPVLSWTYARYIQPFSCHIPGDMLTTFRRPLHGTHMALTWHAYGTLMARSSSPHSSLISSWFKSSDLNLQSPGL